MPVFDINDLASIGLITDKPPYLLPPEAWTKAENVRYVDGSIERFGGWAQTFGTPPARTDFLMPLNTSANTFWLWMSLVAGYVWDGATHTVITRAAGGAYNAGATRNWNGTILGGVGILNNGVDIPQAWLTPTLATDLVDLPNWQSTVRAKVIRSFGPYLVAFNITKSGTNYPHMVKWSQPADPGSVPNSWNEADPTKDTGEKDLPDVNAGVIHDALPLQSTMFVYKEGSVWQMNIIGGQFIFDFKTFLDTVGIMAPRCVCVSGDGRRHVFMSQDDVLWHNGNQVGSILDGRTRRRLYNDIDPQNFVNSFVFPHPMKNEVWICYPTSGSVLPNRALVWNYNEGRGALSEVNDISFVNAANGTIEIGTGELWSDNPGEVWDTETGPWSQIERRRVVLATAGTKFYNLDSGFTKDGNTVVATLQREALSLEGKKRDGEIIVDFEVMKYIQSVWPKVRDGQLRIRVGTQQFIGGEIVWSNFITFDSSNQIVTYPYVECGRAVAIEFSSIGNQVWKLDGYKIECELQGKF